MTAQTVTTAVEQRKEGPGAMIEQYRADFTTVLPSHINGATWVRLAQGVLRRDKNLARIAQANPGSLMQALLEAARLGHEPGTNAFYLVPFGNEIQGIEGYRGIVERIYRAGAVSAVKAEVVYDNDTFAWSPNMMDKPVHEVDWFGDRGAIKGAYAYCEMRDGSTSRVVVIGQDYIAKVKKESRGSSSSSSPWTKWPDAMVLKTVTRRLEAWVPTSAEYMREALRAIRDVQAEAPGTTTLPAKQPDTTVGQIAQPHDDTPAGVDVISGEVIDGDVVEQCGICGTTSSVHDDDLHEAAGV